MILQAPGDLLGTADLEVPCTANTRSGVEFDPSLDLWKYIDGVNGVKLHFGEVEAPLKLRQALKLALTWYAEHLSPSHLATCSNVSNTSRPQSR